MNRRCLGLVGLLLSLVIVSAIAAGAGQAASDYPSQPITYVIPFAPGGATDLIGRALQPHIEEYLGVPLAAINMPGAATAVGHEYVYNAPRDGYTVLVQPTDIVSIAVMGQSELTHRDFTVLGVAAAVPATLVVHPNSPFKTLEDLVAAMKERTLTFGGADSGCAWTRSTNLLATEVGTKPPLMVPMGGGYNAAVSAMKREVDVGACGLPEAIELIRGGSLRALTTFGARDYHEEGLGTIRSVGSVYPQLQPYLPNGGWVGVAIPKDMPADITAKLQEAVSYAMSTDEFQKFCADNAFEFVGLTGEEAAEYVATSTSVNAWMLYDLGVAPISPAEFGIPRP